MPMLNAVGVGGPGAGGGGGLSANSFAIPSQLGGQQSGRSVSQSTSGTGIVPGMMDLYNQTLGLNQSNYQNILGAYGGAGANMQATLPGIYQGYGNLQGQVANTLGQGGTWGVATPAAQAISEAFTKTQGQTQQDLINRGLGNSSAMSSASNQNTMMAGRAYGNLGAQLAQTYAGYEAQLGSAQLGAQMQGLGMQTQNSQAMGSTLASQKYQLPNVLGSYGSSGAYGAREGPGQQQGGGFGGMRGNPNGGGNSLPMEQGGAGPGYGAYGNVTPTGAASGYNPFNPGVGGGRQTLQPKPDQLNYPEAYGFNNPETGQMVGSGLTTDAGPQNPYDIDLG